LDKMWAGDIVSSMWRWMIMIQATKVQRESIWRRNFYFEIYCPPPHTRQFWNCCMNWSECRVWQANLLDLHGFFLVHMGFFLREARIWESIGNSSEKYPFLIPNIQRSAHRLWKDFDMCRWLFLLKENVRYQNWENGTD
jgi:hypothetical protein